MGNYQKAIAVMLIVCLVPLPCSDALTLLQGAAPPDPALAKQQVELFGAGAAVKLKLAGGKKLRGSIGAIEEQGFDLISHRGASTRRITYDQVSELKLAKLTYRASGVPNAEQARRVAAGLGVGKHVAIKVASGKKFRGHIQAINDDHFVVLLDREARSIEIAYADVRKLGPNLSSGAKIAIIVGVVVIVVVIIWAVTVRGVAEEFFGP